MNVETPFYIKQKQLIFGNNDEVGKNAVLYFYLK